MPRIPVLVVALGLAAAWSAADEPGAGLLLTDSRAPYVHRLTLYDHDGAAIDPTQADAPPYSPRMTCGKCHPYDRIAGGWHFNEPRPEAAGGRPGEPWLLIDPGTGTVLPLSGRGWPGTFAPEAVGLSDWQFVLRFGRHLPGGGYGEPDGERRKAAREAARWRVSGALEIDCLVCHAAAPGHDPAERARQVEAQNFRWAPTVAAGLAVVRGEARKAPDDWDPEAPPDPDRPDRSGPRLVYDRTKFDPDQRVLFDLTRRPPAERCYFCHTVREAGVAEERELLGPRDVHLAAGLTCTDCHRNELDHHIVRGYGATAAPERELLAANAALTCEGCHLGTTDGAPLGPDAAGTHGAPYPQHRGLPPVHFEKMTCTACHSGPWPDMAARRFQTALAHGLGLASRQRRDTDPPLILAPIFGRNADGRIEPQRMAWPAYWGRLDGERITPLLPEVVRKLAGPALPTAAKDAEAPASPPLTGEQIAAVLGALGRAQGAAGAAVYVRDGSLYQLGEDGALAVADGHPAAAAYCWPLGHEVRPASQSLGIGGCTDCHVDGAPIVAGYAATQPAAPGAARMFELRGDDPRLVDAWAAAFAWRPVFKVFAFACAGVLTLVLLRSGLDGLLMLLRGRP